MDSSTATDLWPYGALSRTKAAGAAPALSNGTHLFTGHERESMGTATGSDPLDGLDCMHARYYAFNLGRFLSVDPVGGEVGLSQSWNRYAYVRGKPLLYLDSTGEVVDFSLLTDSQRTRLLEQLNRFTGNTYALNGNCQLQLVHLGDNSSPTATNFLDAVISSAEKFSVVDTSGPTRWNDELEQVEINFKRVETTTYRGGKYTPELEDSFNLGSTLMHELVHGATGLLDQAPDAAEGNAWTGPVVDFVNEVRAERGLPLRARYFAKPAGWRDRLQGIPFILLNPRKPLKVYYVYQNRR